MAERTFDYANIAEIYKSMKSIAGEAGDADSIAGVLDLANKEMENKVGVEEEALFGPLADQLKLNWENFSSDFPNFVANFNNWATVVSNAAGQYSQFEQEVQAHRDANPLGFASQGRANNYIVDSYYQTYAKDNFEDWQVQAANLSGLYALTGAVYLDAGKVEKLQQHQSTVKFIETGAAVSVGIIAVSTVGAAYTLSPQTLAFAKGPIGAAARGLAGVLPGTKTAKMAKLDTKAAELQTRYDELNKAFYATDDPVEEARLLEEIKNVYNQKTALEQATGIVSHTGEASSKLSALWDATKSGASSAASKAKSAMSSFGTKSMEYAKKAGSVLSNLGKSTGAAEGTGSTVTAALKGKLGKKLFVTGMAAGTGYMVYRNVTNNN